MSYKSNIQNLQISSSGDLGVGNLPTSLDSSAILEVDSTTKGFLPPRVTTAQRNAISSPSEGLVVYNTDTDRIEVKTPTFWDATFSLISAGFVDAIVGSAIQVSVGKATHSSIQSAIDSVAAGGKVFILEGTYVESLTINKEVFLEGKGHNSSITGTVTITPSSSYSLIKYVRFNGNLILNSGSTANFIRECWIGSTYSVTDSGSANSILIIQE